MSSIYRNRSIINQRGGSIDIDNTTEQEKIKISQRSGSNISITNVVNSELATNNKQVNVVHDSFETIGGDKSQFIVGSNTVRTGQNSYKLNGFVSTAELDAFKSWKDAYKIIADINGQFKITRGGSGYPNGTDTIKVGDRDKNPVIGTAVCVVENKFNGYSGTPLRKSSQDDVANYSKVPDHGKTVAASTKKITVDDIKKSAGSSGSKAPGVLKFGPDKSASTENGLWTPNVSAQQINKLMLNAQPSLSAIEQAMGHGGDSTIFIKRNKVEQIGAVFNDYPSIRIDEEGRSQPFEMLVSTTGTYKNHDYVPHVEEVDNSTNFPGGNDDKIVSNRYTRTVGSGGIQLKTTGATELGGATLKAGYKRINMNASHGIQIASEAFVEIQSLKTITIRSNRQVYIGSALGVRGNVIVAGGVSIEGELYCQHITAPLEVHQTEDTIVFGKFATDSEGSLLIGYAHVGDAQYPVFATSADDTIMTYPHSHHHNGIAMRLTKSNEDVRKFAQNENINNHTTVSQALAQNHERKQPQTA